MHATDRKHVSEFRFRQQGGEMKNPPCQSARRVSRKLYQLFSSFLRGASCPKSPRVAATAASSFMPDYVAEVKGWSQGKSGGPVPGSWSAGPRLGNRAALVRHKPCCFICLWQVRFVSQSSLRFSFTLTGSLSG